MNKKLKFVVTATYDTVNDLDPLAQIHADVRSALDAVRKSLGSVYPLDLEKMRLLLDGRVELTVGTSFIFFNAELGKMPAIKKQVRSAYMTVCEDMG